jgi:hypothetical protein
VQKADMRVDALDHLTVELQHEAQYAVRRRVLGPKLRVKLRRAFSAITASRQPSVQRRPLTGGSNLRDAGTAAAGARAANKKARSRWPKGARPNVTRSCS